MVDEPAGVAAHRPPVPADGRTQKRRPAGVLPAAALRTAVVRVLDVDDGHLVDLRPAAGAAVHRVETAVDALRRIVVGVGIVRRRRLRRRRAAALLVRVARRRAAAVRRRHRGEDRRRRRRDRRVSLVGVGRRLVIVGGFVLDDDRRLSKSYDCL